MPIQTRKDQACKTRSEMPELRRGSYATVFVVPPGHPATTADAAIAPQATRHTPAQAPADFQDIRDWYRKGYGNSTVRLVGAVDFARHGIDGIWFAALPVSKKDLIPDLEAAVIKAAEDWNSFHNYPPLCNVHWRKSDYRTHLDGARPG